LKEISWKEKFIFNCSGNEDDKRGEFEETSARTCWQYCYEQTSHVVVVISYTQVSRIQTGVGLTEQTHKRKKWRKIIQQGENVFSSVRISHESSCDLNRRELLLLLKRLSSFNTYMMD